MEAKYRRLLTFTGVRKRARRGIKRYPVNVEVVELNGQPTSDTYLLDISIHGTKLETSIPLSRHYRVSISFLLQWLERPITALGRVMWVTPLEESPGRFQMGLKFDHPVWELQKLTLEHKL